MNLFQVTKKQEGGGLELQTFTGNPVTFTPSYSEALPAPFNGTNLKVNITAKQDLHGYDHPWAGGAGKNKFALNASPYMSAQNMGVTVNSETESTLSITSSNVAYACRQLFYELSAGTYTISIGNTTKTGTGIPVISIYEYPTTNLIVNALQGNNSFTFTLSGTTVLDIRLFATADTAEINTVTFNNVQIEAGSQQTDYSPYSNICPIVGHSELNLVRCGKNLIDTTVTSTSGITATKNADGSITLSGIATDNAYVTTILDRTIPAGTYTFTATNSTTGIEVIYTQNGNYGGRFNPILTRTFSESSVIGGYIYIRIVNGTDLTTPVTIYPQMEVGGSSTAYAPYNGTPYLVSFGQTVYGGVYDANRGKVTITWGSVDLGTLNWIYDSGIQRFQAIISGIKRATSASDLAEGLLCEVLVPDSAPIMIPYPSVDNTICKDTSTDNVYVICSAYSDATAFKTAMTGKKIVYELATPIEIDVSELSVDTIVGVNNIVSDCGGDITVTCLI